MPVENIIVEILSIFKTCVTHKNKVEAENVEAVILILPEVCRPCISFPSWRILSGEVKELGEVVEGGENKNWQDVAKEGTLNNKV